MASLSNPENEFLLIRGHGHCQVVAWIRRDYGINQWQNIVSLDDGQAYQRDYLGLYSDGIVIPKPNSGCVFADNRYIDSRPQPELFDMYKRVLRELGKLTLVGEHHVPCMDAETIRVIDGRFRYKGSNRRPVTCIAETLRYYDDKGWTNFYYGMEGLKRIYVKC